MPIKRIELYHIHCDICQVSGGEPQLDIEEARKEASSLGWLCNGRKFFCPDCKTTKAKKPNIYSAANTARAVSRRLRSSGLDMSNQDNRSRWTEGVYVHRVGYSRTVAISYHIPHSINKEARSRARVEAMKQVYDLLTSLGYPLIPLETGKMTYYIECERD